MKKPKLKLSANLLKCSHVVHDAPLLASQAIIKNDDKSPNRRAVQQFFFNSDSPLRNYQTW